MWSLECGAKFWKPARVTICHNMQRLTRICTLTISRCLDNGIRKNIQRFQRQTSEVLRLPRKKKNTMDISTKCRAGHENGIFWKTTRQKPRLPHSKDRTIRRHMKVSPGAPPQALQNKGTRHFGTSNQNRFGRI